MEEKMRVVSVGKVMNRGVWEGKSIGGMRGEKRRADLVWGRTEKGTEREKERWDIFIYFGIVGREA